MTTYSKEHSSGATAGNVYPDHFANPSGEIARASPQMVGECQLASTLRHRNIVHFLEGCYIATDSRLPVIALTSLHDLLTPPSPGTPAPLPFFTLGVKCSVLRDVANGLDYLHHQTPPITYRDLSARNILLCSGLVAKIADAGVARRTILTNETYVYMPPEALTSFASNSHGLKQDTCTNVFSFGVITMFTISETFPCDILEPNYLEDESKRLATRTELQRRIKYKQSIDAKLRACGKFHENHPLIQLIQRCLDNSAHLRPNIREVLRLLEKAIQSEAEIERNKRKLVGALLDQPENQVRIWSKYIAT